LQDTRPFWGWPLIFYQYAPHYYITKYNTPTSLMAQGLYVHDETIWLLLFFDVPHHSTSLWCLMFHNTSLAFHHFSSFSALLMVIHKDSTSDKVELQVCYWKSNGIGYIVVGSDSNFKSFISFTRFQYSCIWFQNLDINIKN